MKTRNLRIIISREYLTRVRKKSFLLTTFLVPVLLAALFVLPSVIMQLAKDEQRNVAVIDQSGIVKAHLLDNELVKYNDYSTYPVDSLKSDLADLGMDILLVVSPLDTLARSVSVTTYSEKPLSVETKGYIAENASEAIEAYRTSLYDITDLEHIIEDVKADVPVSTYVIDEYGNEKITSSEVYMIVSMILSMVIYMFIALFSGMVMQSVIEEKSSRIVEVLVSSVKATELMFGKIIGVACVALTQFFLWIMLTVVLVVGFAPFIGLGAMTDAAPEIEQITKMTTQMAGTDLSNITAVMEQDGGMSTIISTLQGIDWSLMLISFVVYFIFGYLLYASFFAAIGSAVENEADTNQLQMPVTIPLLLAFLIAIYAFNAPDSPVVWWGSMIPFTSPIVMLARIPYGVPLWELALSLSLLAATFVACGWFSAKIYKIGVLMFGKKTTFSDLWKWIRQK